MIHQPSSSSHDEEDELSRTQHPRIVRGDTSSDGGDDNSYKDPILLSNQLSMCNILTLIKYS